ncbi:hypothetical protein BYT27DRAFT_7194785 [Phlegmacium glaucopus]|nr:hypothetical protein BYT27DRAFT_7194785 [Phlegmacium glaucopus]
MQKDEEVGKVAQATPIVISKALELFLGLIIEESHKVTSNRGSKKVEAYHLKHAVETTEMLDFLKEIVQAIPDPSAGGTIDLDAEGGDVKKRRGKGKRAAAGEVGLPKRRRKKKGETGPAPDDDDDAPGERGEIKLEQSAGDQEEDVEMQDDRDDKDDRDDYDDDDDSRPSAPSYRPSSR